MIEQRLQEDEHAWRAKYESTPDCPYEPPNKYSNGLWVIQLPSPMQGLVSTPNGSKTGAGSRANNQESNRQRRPVYSRWFMGKICEDELTPFASLVQGCNWGNTNMAQTPSQLVQNVVV